MLHLLFWLTRSLLFLLFKFFICTWVIFLACCFIHLSKIKQSPFLLLSLPLSFFLIFLVSPLWVRLFLSTLCSILIIFTFPPNYSIKVNSIKLFIESVIILIKIREIIFISDKNYFRLKSLKLNTFLFFVLLSTIIFISFYQLTIFFLILGCSLTAILLGLSLRFFSSLFSFPFSSPPISSEPDSFGTSPHQFAAFLKLKIDSHPLNAMIEENFYEDNLQIGDFFLSYPLFFKASPLNSPFSSPEEEIISLWHTIRWESAFSKQTGSAASRWSSLYGINSSIPTRAHSVHTPLIPVFRNEIFDELKKNKLPVFDPFIQPPEWNPYFLVISFLNWSEDEIKEERLIEIEEED